MHFFIRALALVFVSTTLGTAEQDEFTLEVDVPVVSVDVSVTDQDGVPVDGLTPSDFRVFENEVPQEVRYFGPSAAPYHTYLLFDSSGSTRHKWEFMRHAVAGFLANLKPQDRVSVGVFDSRLLELRGWDNPREDTLRVLDPVIDSRPPGGTTEFYQALERALEEGFDGITERRAIVLLTDGRDSSLYREVLDRSGVLEAEDDRRFRRVYREAETRRIPIYIVAVNTDRNIEENRQGGDEYRNLQILYGDSPVPEMYLEQVRIRLERLAEVSGGQVSFPRTIEEVVPLYEQIGKRLGSAYSLGYVPPAAAAGGEFRRIVVTAGDYNVVQSRTGYYAR